MHVNVTAISATWSVKFLRIVNELVASINRFRSFYEVSQNNMAQTQNVPLVPQITKKLPNKYSGAPTSTSHQ
jgi:hypothetical protein